jgi:hypothetical protein
MTSGTFCIWRLKGTTSRRLWSQIFSSLGCYWEIKNPESKFAPCMSRKSIVSRFHRFCSWFFRCNRFAIVSLLNCWYNLRYPCRTFLDRCFYYFDDYPGQRPWRMTLVPTNSRRIYRSRAHPHLFVITDRMIVYNRTGSWESRQLCLSPR